jgi:hypothetical protein
MKYSELFQFEAIQGAVRLQDAETKDGAARLVATYVISDAMAACLTGCVFPHLQFDQPAAAKALLVVGNHGTGKTHLMAVVSSLAEHADLVDATPQLKALKVDPTAQAEGRVGVDAVAGRFKVIRTELGTSTRSLRERLLRRMEEYLWSQGVRYSFPPGAKAPDGELGFHEMMAAFHQQFPNHGLLLVVDKLLDYLQTRKGEELISDLNFLRELGVACQHLRFRFIAGVHEAVLDHPQFGLVADSLRGVKDRFEQVLLGAHELRFAVAERLVPKTPAQKRR